MSRPKKTSQQISTNSIETPVDGITTKPSTSQLSYSGRATVSVVKKGKIVSKSNSHNNGTINLFNFFSLCLADNWAAASLLKPVKIKYFKANNATDDTADDTVDFDTDTNSVSAYIYYNTKPKVITTPEISEAVFHFTAPGSYITLEEGTVILAGVALYNAEGIQLASTVFSKDNRITLTDQNMNVVLDWHLSVSNNNPTTTN